MSKKYELLKDDTVNHLEKTLYRVKRLSDGLLGGYIESERNLSQYGDCFVYDSARVFGSAYVFGNAHVYGNASVFGSAYVSGNAEVSGDAYVYDNAYVSGNARVYGTASVYGNARVYDSAEVSGNGVLRNCDKISDTRHYFNILGFQYPITVTYNSINIGCKSFTIDQLDTVFSDKEYYNNENIPMIKAMIEIALNKILRDL